MTQALEKLLARTVQGGPDGACMEWTGARDHRGYGTVYFNGRNTTANRAVLSLTKGIQAGEIAAQSCRNHSCINPAHLYAGARKGAHKSPPAIADQLLARVEYDTNGGCWLWTGALNRGYGRHTINIPAVHHWLAHRLSYRTFVGPIEGGLFVCHKCDVRTCINPSHLFLGTAADNGADMAAKGRAWVPRSEESPTAKLSSADASNILALYREGASPTVLAKRFNVQSRTIHYIAAGKTWKQIPRAALSKDAPQ